MELLNLLAHHVATVFENARLFESATYERLTGLLRREAILEQLDRELERAARYGRPLTIAMADLDHFKAVNDRYGHLAGRRAAAADRRRCSPAACAAPTGSAATAARSSCWCCPRPTWRAPCAVAEKIRALVQGTLVPMDDGTPARVTLSIGLASLDELRRARGRSRGRDLIAAADRSLYAAKHAGRNRVFPRVA